MSTVIPSTFEAFPECPGFGFTAQPQYLVKINARSGGFENINRRWPRPLTTYVAVPMPQRSDVDVQAVLYFWHAVGGMARRFLFKDWTDFQSSPIGVVPAADQPLQLVVTIAGGATYQMKKLYTVGSLTQERDITRPVASTIRVYSNVTEKTNFTIDENTGLIQAGDGDTLTAWGGEFYVPARFDSQLSIMVVDKEIQGVDFTVRETREELDTENFGGSP